MRRLAAAGCLAALLVAPPASALAAPSDVNLQVALDKPAKLEATDMPISKVFQRLTDATGVKFLIGPEVYACLPYGKQTQLTVKLPQRTLRDALSPILAPLAMAWTIEAEAVRIVPSAALLRMTRRATREELIALGNFYSAKVQPTAKAGSVLQQLRKATGNQDLNLMFHRVKVDEKALIERAERVLPAPAAAWLDMLCHGRGLTWYLWGDDIMIVERKTQIERQLQKKVSLRYNNADLVAVLLDLAKKAHVKLDMDPGVLEYLPEETKENFNLIMAEATVSQALEVISGATGLVFIREADGIKVLASERLKTKAAGSSGTRKRRAFFLKHSVPLPGGGSVDIIIPPDEMPEELKKAILAERQRLFRALYRKYGLTTQPAATQPAKK